MKEDLCLTFHCLRSGNAVDLPSHPELFVELDELADLIKSLKLKGYRFGLPGDTRIDDRPICTVTFDDGYYNNTAFLELASHFEVPFILFVVSSNIQHQNPFIWDLVNIAKGHGLEPARYIDFESVYAEHPEQFDELMSSDHYRPFTAQELQSFNNCRWTNLALHSHTHRPFIGSATAWVDKEIKNNLGFLKQYEGHLARDLALPNGLSTKPMLRYLFKFVDRIYSIDGGRYNPNDKIIKRYSLVDSRYGGPLKKQVSPVSLLNYRLKRKVHQLRSKG